MPLSDWLIREGTCPEVIIGLPFVGFFGLLLSAISFVSFGFKFLGQITAHRFGLIASDLSQKEDGCRLSSALSVIGSESKVFSSALSVLYFGLGTKFRG